MDGHYFLALIYCTSGDAAQSDITTFAKQVLGNCSRYMRSITMWRDSMASIVYWTNKKNGNVYAYSSESYWDKEKKAPRSRRTYLGRVDPETGEIIKGTRRAQAQAKVIKEKKIEDIENDVIRDLREQIEQLQEKNSKLEAEVREYKSKYQRARQLAQAILEDG